MKSEKCKIRQLKHVAAKRSGNGWLVQLYLVGFFKSASRTKQTTVFLIQCSIDLSVATMRTPLGIVMSIVMIDNVKCNWFTGRFYYIGLPVFLSDG